MHTAMYKFKYMGKLYRNMRNVGLNKQINKTQTPFTVTPAQTKLIFNTSPQPVTGQDAEFSSEVAANLSSGWICTNWIFYI